MIPGFEAYTYRLTDYEKQTLLPILIKLLKGRKGVEKAILNSQIQVEFEKQYYKDKKYYKNSAPRVRKMINHIRTNGIIKGLVATSKGYYITNNPAELQKYISSLDYRSKVISVLGDHMKLHLAKMKKTKAA